MLRRLALTLLPPLALCVPAQSACAESVAQPPSLAVQMEQLLSAARFWLDKKEPERAGQMLERALLLQPASTEALALKGELELKENRPLQAARWLEQLQRQAPHDPFTRELADAYRIATVDRQNMARAQMLARAGKHDEALVLLRRLFPAGQPTGPVALDYYRILGAGARERAQALDGLERLAAAAPHNMSYQLVLAELMIGTPSLRARGLKLAMALYRRPTVDNRQALELWRRGLLAVGKQPEQLAALDAYLVEDPADISVQDLRKDVADMVEARRKLEADPGWQTGQRGLRLLAAGQVDAAVTTLQQALRSRPNDAELVGNLGLAYLRQGQHGLAEQMFARAAALDDEGRRKWLGLIATARLWGGLAETRAALAAGRLDEADSKLRAIARQSPHQPELGVLTGDLQAARKRWQPAEQAYRAALEGGYDAGALRGWAAVLRASGRSAQVLALLTRYRERYPAAAAEIDRMVGRELADEADLLAAAGRRGPAMAKYERALVLLPDDPWLRFHLAGLYHDLGVPAQGRAVMADGMAVAASPAMRYAAALYLGSLDDNDGALALLSPLADQDRDAAMRLLEQRLQVHRALLAAEQAQRAGKRGEGQQQLAEAARLAGDNGELRADVAQGYVSAGQAEPGLKLLDDWLVLQRDGGTLPLRLRRAGLLAQARRDDMLAARLDELEREQGLSAEQRQRVEQLGLELALRRTDALLAGNRLAEAQQMLAPLAARWGGAPRYWQARAELALAGRDYAAAEGAVRKALARAPQDFDSRLLLVRVQEGRRQMKAARAALDALLADTAADDIAGRLALVRRYQAQQHYADAGRLLQGLRDVAPQDATVKVQSGHLAAAEGDYRQAADWYRSAMPFERAGQALAGLEERRQPLLAGAYDLAVKSGDDGISRLKAVELPLYGQLPAGYDGHLFAQVDHVALDAGSVDPGTPGTAAGYGSIAAGGRIADGRVAGLAGPMRQRADGDSFALGYRNDDWRVDLGHTPLGFPVNYWVGGLRWQKTIGDVFYSVDVARRPQTSSLLSYAGGRDPVSGDAWGGVRSTGITLHAGWNVGRLGFSSTVALARLTGEQVQPNRALTARQVFDWAVLERPDQRVTAGLSASYWSYAHNQSGYTLGNGGYYSPQSYLAFGLPLEWSGRSGRLAWRLDATAGLSRARTAAQDAFPTRPDLQRQAQNNAGAFGRPVTDAGTGGGFGYGATASVEYRVTPHWVVGGVLGVDRSKDYAPNRAQLYFRYNFKAQQGPVDYPPSPVRPYSRY